MARSDRPRGTRTPHDPPDHEQPGREDGRRVRALDILEERRIRQARRVVEGEEDNAPPGPYGRRLRRHLHASDEQLSRVAAAQQIGRRYDPERGEQAAVTRHDVVRDVDAEDAQLGGDPFGVGHLGQAGRRYVDGLGLEVERLLHLGDADGRRRLRLPLRQVARVVGDQPRHARRGPDPPGARRPGIHLGHPAEIGQRQQQVAPRDLPPGADGQRPPDPVQPVEPAGEDQPLDHWLRHGGAVPEIGERAVRAAGDDTGDRLGRDARDVGQRHPDPPRPAVGKPRARPEPGLETARVRQRGCLATTSRWGRGSSDRYEGVAGLQPLHAVAAVAGVDVEAEDRDAEPTGLVEEEPLRVHAGVVREHPGEEVRRVVGLEPRRLVRGQRERGRVRLAEAERRERGEDLPQPLDELRGVAVAQRSRYEPAPYGLLPLQVAQRPPRLVALRQAAAGRRRR